MWWMWGKQASIRAYVIYSPTTPLSVHPNYIKAFPEATLKLRNKQELPNTEGVALWEHLGFNMRSLHKIIKK